MTDSQENLLTGENVDTNNVAETSAPEQQTPETIKIEDTVAAETQVQPTQETPALEASLSEVDAKVEFAPAQEEQPTGETAEMLQPEDEVAAPVADATQEAKDAKQEDEEKEPEKPAVVLPHTQEEVIIALKKMTQAETIAKRSEVEPLKQLFYRLYSAQVTADREKFVNDGGKPEDFIPEPNSLEEEFKQVINELKRRRAEQQAELEKQKEQNLLKKQAILERIKEMSATPESANQNYKEFRELQNQWRELTLIPVEKINELRKTYQLYVEQFYDQRNLNKELREYDFKKNLETKTALCEAAEKLSEEPDVIKAFQELQLLHLEFKECGPVAPELRESIWTRFKTASTVVNKRHQQHFEELKKKEKKNLELKTALCEKIEAIDVESIKTVGAWDTNTKQILEIQKEWRTIGYAPKKMNDKIFERFRSACDHFFTEKATFFKHMKEEQTANLAKKNALCEAAEALKESTEWKATADKLKQLQKEWKTIGAVPKRHSEAVWNRFKTACDYFFEQKNKVTQPQREEETENLNHKNEILQKLNTLLESTDEQDVKVQTAKNLIIEWNEIGFVPFREKDKIFKAYQEVTDKLSEALGITFQRYPNRFKGKGTRTASTGHPRERERLMRTYESKRNEIKTYENNIGFLNCKKGSTLLEEMEKKMQKLKDELQALGEKIAALDASEKEKENAKKPTNTDEGKTDNGETTEKQAEPDIADTVAEKQVEATDAPSESTVAEQQTEEK